MLPYLESHLFYTDQAPMSDPGQFIQLVICEIIVRDFLFLNQVEILPWDVELGAFTHRLHDPLPDKGPELAFYDEMPVLTLAGNQAFEHIRTWFEAKDR